MVKSKHIIVNIYTTNIHWPTGHSMIWYWIEYQVFPFHASIDMYQAISCKTNIDFLLYKQFHILESKLCKIKQAYPFEVIDWCPVNMLSNMTAPPNYWRENGKERWACAWTDKKRKGPGSQCSVVWRKLEYHYRVLYMIQYLYRLLTSLHALCQEKLTSIMWWKRNLLNKLE